MRVKAREGDVQKAIMDLLAAKRIFAIRINTVNIHIGSRYLRAHSAGPGLADILAFVNPPLWIEVKSETGKQSAEQKSFEQYVTEQGHKYIIARSTEDVLEQLTGE